MRIHEPMSRHTSWKAGGTAHRFYRPADRDDLQLFMSSLPADEQVAWVGLGSNLLVRDGGFDGTLIHTRGCLNTITDDDDRHFIAECGVSCAVAARHATRRGLVGLEFFAGIPGTVGGALAMNAGAFGGETWQYVSWVEMISRRGEIIRRQPEEFDVAYRQVTLPVADEWFLSACFQLQPGATETAREKTRELLDQRAASQPVGEASCGSTFRNPPGNHAARLIEHCGLKGYCIGDACVSEKHANFLVNRGNATAADIETLADKVADRVFAQTGIRLQREFHVIGSAKEAAH